MSGRRHVFFAPSGRCAIAQVLSVLPQKEVVMPAWTCSVVKGAAEVAGKRIIYVDIERNALNATSVQYARAAKPGRILLPTHLLGIPTDIVQVCDLARDRGCITIEDAAAAFPARLGGRLLGTFGDVGIISFEKSKRVPSFRGAAIIVNNENAIDVKRLARHRVVPTTGAMPVRELLFCVAYNVATNPWLYGRITLPRRLRLYMTKSSPEGAATPAGRVPTPLEAASDKFYSRDFHPYQAALVTRILTRIGSIREHIKQLMSIYQDAFRDTSILTFVPPGCDTAGLLRFPIAFPGKERSEILRVALRRGIFFDVNYELLLPDAADQGSFPNSLWAAQNLVLLPLYRSLPLDASRRLASRVIEMEREICSRRLASVIPGSVGGVGPGRQRAGAYR